MTDANMDDALFATQFEPRDLSQLHHHITIRDFGEKLQKAANAAYPNDQQSECAVLSYRASQCPNICKCFMTSHCLTLYEQFAGLCGCHAGPLMSNFK